ncbi:MAG: hypothetical protein OXC91_01260 [Rhodobacteraceae bacterium]|nr:hypothetical protein [Paracoccaceae bacterium]
MIRLSGLILLLLTASAPAAPPPELTGRIDSARPAGCTVYWLLFISLYRAELWSDSPSLPGEEYGLSLVYRTPFSGKQLVKASIAEMSRISGRPASAFDGVRSELETAMRAVRRGDRYTAWRDASGRIEFFLNGETTGVLTEDGDLFMAIWLGPHTRYPQRRNILTDGVCHD